MQAICDCVRTEGELRPETMQKLQQYMPSSSDMASSFGAPGNQPLVTVFLLPLLTLGRTVLVLSPRHRALCFTPSLSFVAFSDLLDSLPHASLRPLCRTEHTLFAERAVRGHSADPLRNSDANANRETRMSGPSGQSALVWCSDRERPAHELRREGHS